MTLSKDNRNIVLAIGFMIFVAWALPTYLNSRMSASVPAS